MPIELMEGNVVTRQSKLAARGQLLWSVLSNAEAGEEEGPNRQAGSAVCSCFSAVVKLSWMIDDDGECALRMTGWRMGLST